MSVEEKGPTYKWLVGGLIVLCSTLAGTLWRNMGNQVNANIATVSANVTAVATLTENVRTLADQVKDLKDDVKELKTDFRGLKHP